MSNTPLQGHTSLETAYMIADYPYGSLRCKRRVWLEFDAKRGFRFVAQTENPKTGRWNAPKKSTYVEVAACLYLDDKQHVQWAGVGEYTQPDQALEFARNYGAQCAGRDRLCRFAMQKGRLCEALADGKARFTINGAPQARSEMQRADDTHEATVWAQVASLASPI
jgi:hypothetical protein